MLAYAPDPARLRIDLTLERVSERLRTVSLPRYASIPRSPALAPDTPWDASDALFARGRIAQAAKVHVVH